jgi:cell wall-associated NlpC family hydrolase
MAADGLQARTLAGIDSMNALDENVLNRFIGKPWKFWQFGPEEFDCWGLTVTAARALFGIAMPDIPVNLAAWPGTPALAAAQLRGGQWEEVPEARAGAVLALLDMRGRIRHTSLCIGADKVPHTTEAGR